jgi:hypothetical protein
MAEIDPKQIKETTTKISIKRKYEVEIKEKQKQIEKLEADIEQVRANIQRDNYKQKKELENTAKGTDAFNLFMLSNVISTTYGNGDLSSLTNKLFKEEELFEYKAKMLEILKRL